jgi:hypothetical protein
MQFPSYFRPQHSKPETCYHGRPASADAIVMRLQDICRTRPGGNRMSTPGNARLPYRDGHG